MEYLHIKNLEKYQPGYTDRRHIWAKIYYDTFTDEKIQALDEIDRYRFLSLIVMEVWLQKPVALTETNLKILGWNAQKRRIPLSLQMLHTLVDVCNGKSDVSVPQSRVEKSRVEKSIYGTCVFLSSSEHEKLVSKLGEQQTKRWIEELDLAIASKGYKYKSHYATILNWHRRKYPPAESKPTEAEQKESRNKKEQQRRNRIRAEDESLLREKDVATLKRMRAQTLVSDRWFLIDEILKAKQ